MVSALYSNLGRLTGWTDASQIQIKTSLTDYLDAMVPYGNITLWSTGSDSETVGAPSAHSYYYEITNIVRASTILVIATRMNNSACIRYMKQKYANTWGNWIEL